MKSKKSSVLPHVIRLHGHQSKSISQIILPANVRIQMKKRKKDSADKIINSSNMSMKSPNERSPSYVTGNISWNTKTAWSDGLGMPNDYHRQQLQKKKKPHCIKKMIIISLILVLIIGAILAAILLTFASKSKSTTTSSALRWYPAAVTIAGIANTNGTANYLLNAPYDVTLDYPNAFYVADQNNNRVQKFLTGSTNGSTVAGYANGSTSWYTNALFGPTRVLLDPNKNIYVSDTSHHQVKFLLKDNLTATALSDGLGSAINQLFNPYGLDRNPNTDGLYIADSVNHRIMYYTKNVTNRVMIAGNNESGSNTYQLNNPRGLYFDSLTNSLVIVNHGTANVVRWTIGASNWTLIANNVNVSSNLVMSSPIDVTFDPMGNMYIADRANHRILMFKSAGQNRVNIVGTYLVSGSNATLLNSPTSVELDAQLNLYVTDSNNHRIQKFLRY